MGTGVIILLVIVAVIVIWFIATYNSFINLKTELRMDGHRLMYN